MDGYGGDEMDWCIGISFFATLGREAFRSSFFFCLSVLLAYGGAFKFLHTVVLGADLGRLFAYFSLSFLLRDFIYQHSFFPAFLSLS